jgi:homoserine O-succinyltransferase
MTLLFDKDRPIKSPALAPAQDEFERAGEGELTIGLINNMPDSALKATERQFMRLVQAASGDIRINFHCFSLPTVARSKPAREHIAQDYADIADLDRLQIDGLIVTGAEPIADALPDEPFWGELTDIIDWAKTNTRSTIWSCLAAHAAVLHLDGVERHRLSEKCSGVYDCAKATDDWLTRDLPATLKVSHSRYNELRESELAAHGYEILTRSDVAGVDIFARQLESRFIFFQGHPEYDASSLQREYMRDLARFLAGERDLYPNIPAGYFDAATVAELSAFEMRARTARNPMQAAELPGLTFRPDLAVGAAANVIFANWLGFLRQEASANEPASSRK